MFRLLYRLLVSLVALAARSGRSKDLEIVVLRHQLAVLQRTAKSPMLNDTDRSLLAAIGRFGSELACGRSAASAWDGMMVWPARARSPSPL